jgi:dienelactone hydrolase
VAASALSRRGERGALSEHPVLVPTSVGTAGGIVSEPEGDPRAAAVLLPGAGGPGRAGVNAFWTRFARRLAEQGVVALRFDYPHNGNGAIEVPPEIDVAARAEDRDSVDIAVVREMTAWFRRHLEGLDLFVAGECHGGRLAFELLRHDRDLAGLFAVAPYLREDFVPLGVREAAGSPDDEVEILDEELLESIREFVERDRLVWILIGAEEGKDPFRLGHRLGDLGERLEIEVTEECKLHPVASPQVQARVASSLGRRMSRALER